MEIMKNFRDELSALINKHSKENGSNTPDYVLATYLSICLEAFDNAVKIREEWYGRKDKEEGLLIPEKCKDCVYVNKTGFCWAIKARCNPDNINCNYRKENKLTS